MHAAGAGPVRGECRPGPEAPAASLFFQPEIEVKSLKCMYMSYTHTYGPVLMHPPPRPCCLRVALPSFPRSCGVNAPRHSNQVWDAVSLC